jgi:hypothetical protein
MHLENHKRLSAVLDGVAGKETDDILNYWASTYKSFVLLRFDIFSGGGGNWKRLARTTAKRKDSEKILEDTREMRLGLAEGITEVDRDTMSLTMGFTSEKQHTQGTLNVSELATIHDKGRGVPKRRILVLPDNQVLTTLRNGTTKRMARIANGTS